MSENIPVVVYSALPDERSTTALVSGRILELTGYSHQEFMEHAQLWTQIVHPDDREYVWEKTEEHREKMGPLDVEYRIMTKSNTVKWIRDRATPMVDENGQIIRIDGFMEDITERKRAEEALRETTDYLDNLIEHTNVPIIVWNPASRITRFNRASERLTGHTTEEVIGQELRMLFPEGSRDESLRKIERTLEGECWESVEIPILRKDGGIRIALWNSANTYAEDGKTLVSTIAQGQDITERKKAEEAIRASEEKHRTLVENLPQRIFYKDRDSIYVSCNENYASDLKIKPDEIAGKTDSDFYPKELAEKYRADDRRLMESGETEDIEERYIQHGKELTVHTVKTPVRDEEGNVVGILGIFWDITEQRSLEAQLRQSQKMESLGTLAGGVAHDFNNLLGGILGYVGLIKGDYSTADKHYAMLELIEKAGVRAAELTNQLLAFSRKGKYALQVVDLNKSVEDVLKLLSRTLGKNIEIATELQEKLSSVQGDPGQLEQAILNLCVNAAEAMPGGGRLHLETRVVALEEEFTRKYLGSDPGDYVLLSVSDTGIGMDSETISRIFEPFFTTKEVGKGTGLGLSTVYGIVKNHGGYVDVRSQPGKGSTFDVYLPASKEQFTPGQPHTTELKAGRETILAVDDEEIIRSLLKETLEKLGYKVILANEGEEAIQIYEEKKDEIDAVIIDMIMPRVGGCEAFRELKRRNPGVKVLLATGYSQDGTAQQILDEGVKGLIQKPFDLVELSQKLREVLD